MNVEEKIIQVIMNAGSARSYAMEAAASAREKDFGHALELLEQADKSLVEAHKAHAELLSLSATGELELSLLLVHADDQLMAASVSIDFARELVDARRSLSTLEERLNAR